jgi:hypothetical protein
MVESRRKTAAGERLADQAIQSFHAKPQFPTPKERDCEPSR